MITNIIMRIAGLYPFVLLLFSANFYGDNMYKISKIAEVFICFPLAFPLWCPLKVVSTFKAGFIIVKFNYV